MGCDLTVQFSNGKLQNPDNMRFSLYKNKDSTNPRKKSQRILVSAAVANCLHSEASLDLLGVVDVGVSKRREVGR